MNGPAAISSTAGTLARRKLPGSAVDPYLSDWLNLAVRWLHVIAGIAWIGASLYFIHLDLSLEPPKRREDADRGVGGEYWSVHGGGFYHVQKYRVAPERLPEPLHWFKWQNGVTWLSGFQFEIKVIAKLSPPAATLN